MKKGDIIWCHDQKDLRKTMEDLSAAGFHAVKDSGDNFDIRITGVPKTEYLVQARSEGGSVLRTYCDTLEEAEAAAEWLWQGCEFVEILKGYPGEWETVSQNW